MLPLFLDLHDAYLLCSCEQLDFIAAYGEADEYEYENQRSEERRVGKEC